VFRDGAPAPVGTTPSTTFVDVGLVPESVHTYAVQAVDSPGNESEMSGTSAPITALSGPVAIFTDDFSTGDFSRWTTVTRFAIDAATGGIAPPSARAQVVAQSAAMSRTLAASFTSICAGVRVNAASIGSTTLALLRLRSAAGANVVRVFAEPSGILFVRSDVSGTQRRSGVALGTGWHAIELCGTIGAAGSWSLYRDGTAIVTAWTANTGTAGIGRVDLGDTGAKTFTVSFDDVVVDQAPG
jgi:hypothetical protein